MQAGTPARGRSSTSAWWPLFAHSFATHRTRSRNRQQKQPTLEEAQHPRPRARPPLPAASECAAADRHTFAANVACVRPPTSMHVDVAHAARLPRTVCCRPRTAGRQRSRPEASASSTGIPRRRMLAIDLRVRAPELAPAMINTRVTIDLQGAQHAQTSPARQLLCMRLAAVQQATVAALRSGTLCSAAACVIGQHPPRLTHHVHTIKVRVIVGNKSCIYPGPVMPQASRQTCMRGSDATDRRVGCERMHDSAPRHDLRLCMHMIMRCP